MRILALDVGTSSVKAAVLEIGNSLPVTPIARTRYPLAHPEPEAAEIDPERLWEAVVAAARAATGSATGVEAIGLSCLTPALVLLDHADRPLAPIWTHLDRRARPAARRIWADVGPEFLASTGNRPLPGGISAVSWLQQQTQQPMLRRQVHSYLHVNGWLALRLTGQRAFDPANASFSGLFATMSNQAWSERWWTYFGVEPAWLPGVVDGRTTVGALRAEAAQEFGLPSGIPVKLGTADTSSAMLAARMGPGDLLHVVGTTQVLAAIAPVPRPDARRLTRRLGVGEACIHVTHNPVGGAALDWLHDVCFRDQEIKRFYAETIPGALGRQAPVVLDPPFLGGDRLEIETHRAAFREVTLGTDRLDLLAAVLAGMRRGHQEAMAALGLETPIRRVFLTGGGAETVRQLLPEYSSDTVNQLEEGSLRGVARLFEPIAAPGCQPLNSEGMA
jgi:sugar (pentulose or hexulose) kinase